MPRSPSASRRGEEQHQRHHISIAVLKCAKNRDTRPGRRSSGNFSKNFRFSHFVRINGLFDIIVEITNGKCLLSFDVAAPIQIATHTSLAAMIMSTSRRTGTPR